MQDTQDEEMEGVEATGLGNDSLPLFTEDEKRVLDLYDRLEELQLEVALLKAQGVISKDTTRDVSEKDIQNAQQELLEAKAAYSLRSNIVESILVANPILNAVHAGANGSLIEQDLLPLIQQRDTFSVSLTQASSKVLAAMNELTKAESEHIITARKNVELTTTMLALVEEAGSQNKEDITDPKERQQLDDLEEAMKSSRQRWRIMKGTASATIAGSGVDWTRVPNLLEIVLDNDGEED
jgi:hypothetical protein